MSDSNEDQETDVDVEKIINRILSYHKADEPEFDHDWNDPTARQYVRSGFEGDSHEQESILPGFGEDGYANNAQDDCGDPHPFICPNCGDKVSFGRTCGMSVCARCGVGWVRDTAVNKGAKIRRVRKEIDWHDNDWNKLHHQIISPNIDWLLELADQGYSLKEALDEAKKIVKLILKEMGAPGVVIRHSYRGKKDDGSLKPESQHQNDMGFWSDLLNSGRNFYGGDGVRQELAWQPHFHCVVVSPWLGRKGVTDVISEATGWIIHRIEHENDEGNLVSLETDGDMVGAIMYSLSHCDIQIRDDAHNRSAVWEVGSFEDDQIKSSPRFSAKPHDLEWVHNVVQKKCEDVLGMHPSSTDCDNTIPAVDDPDELARRALLELYPEDEEARRKVSTDTVHAHMEQENIKVEVETTDGGGGSVTVTDASGVELGPGGLLDLKGTAANLPDLSGSGVIVDRGERLVRPVIDELGQKPDDQSDSSSQNEDDSDDHDAGDDGSGCDDDDCSCTGTYIPLGEARDRGFLEDDEWVADAPYSHRALEADSEHPDDLDRWQAEQPATAVGPG